MRALTHSEARLHEQGPFTAPALNQNDFDDVFVGEITRPESLAGMLDGQGLAKFTALLSTQFGDLADFIVTAGEIDGVGAQLGTISLRGYFEALQAGNADA